MTDHLRLLMAALMIPSAMSAAVFGSVLLVTVSVLLGGILWATHR